MTNRRKRSIRRVAVITGTRAEYGLLRSTIEAVRRRKSLKLQLVATGMHLLKKFGHTVDQVRRDGWHVDARIKMQSGDDDPLDQAAGLARGVSGIAKFLEDARTDVVVVLGDRIEALAGALACVTTGRVLAHIHGGDVARGDFDEGLRHAITKLAHLHFAATRQARRRIVRMGEREANVHFVGAPGLDGLAELVRRSRKSRDSSGRLLIVQHPCGRSAVAEKRVMNALIRAVKNTGRPHTILYPNSDRGHSGIIEAIIAHRRRSANGMVRVEKHLPRDQYLRCLIDADALVGNSSSG
ncbi:MAG: UDP-N-acetylglucosamine 2-epimerase (hydrolyzing), partial [Planctomycetes bacterium]|nr:UDP-N-acetylglucosamine 2-epimerase (hydrolyzing) [Planctomycetota bacterium]